MLKGQDFPGAFCPEPPSGLHHQPFADLNHLRANFMTIFHEIKHPKTQFLFKNGH